MAGWFKMIKKQMGHNGGGQGDLKWFKNKWCKMSQNKWFKMIQNQMGDNGGGQDDLKWVKNKWGTMVEGKMI